MPLDMRWDVFAWAVFALVLFALEVMAPGAFMLWLAFAASAVLVVVWAVPGLSFLLQAVLFVVLGFVSILIYRKWFRGNDDVPTDQPTLNRRTDQLLGRVVVLQSAIERGSGRVQIADAYWTVSGADLPAGASVRIVGADGMTLRVEAVD
jgi:inner membrane protein